MCTEQSISREIELVRSQIEEHKRLLLRKQERLEELEELAQVYTRRRKRYERVGMIDEEIRIPRRKKTLLESRRSRFGQLGSLFP